MGSAYLEIWIPSRAHANFGRSLLPNSMQDLLGKLGNGLVGSHECVVNNFEPLIMICNKKEHCYLLFHIGVDIII